MAKCARSTIAENAHAAPADDDLAGIARYLGLAVAGEVITEDAAAAALFTWSEGDIHALVDASERARPGSDAERLLMIAASYHPRAAA